MTRCRGRTVHRSGLGQLIELARGFAAKIDFKVHPHIAADAAGFFLANKGTDFKTARQP